MYEREKDVVLYFKFNERGEYLWRVLMFVFSIVSGIMWKLVYGIENYMYNYMFGVKIW